MSYCPDSLDSNPQLRRQMNLATGIARSRRFDGVLVLCLMIVPIALHADNVGVAYLTNSRLADILRQNAETNAPCNACAIVYRVDGTLAASVGVGGIGPDSAYAPGSVVKPLVAMTAFDLGIASADTSVSTNVNDPKYGKLPCDGSRVWLSELTVGQALVRSSNVVFGRLGMQIGLEALLSSYSKFGIGSRIGGLLSETSVALQARIACGHDMLSTPDEIARAYVVLANRGKSPWTGIQIVSTNAVDEYLPYLARVATTEGTARRAAIKGVVVAGKTGTSQRVVDGRYSSGLFDATFVGFYPAYSPRWIILTLFQNASPGDSLRQGGGRSALAFANIVQILEGMVNKEVVMMD